MDTRSLAVPRAQTAATLEGVSLYSTIDGERNFQVMAKGSSGPPYMVSRRIFGEVSLSRPLNSNLWYTVVSDGSKDVWYTMGGFERAKKYECDCGPNAIVVRHDGTYMIDFRIDGGVEGTAKADYNTALVINGAAPAPSPDYTNRPGTEIFGDVNNIGLRVNVSFIVDLKAGDRVQVKMQATNNVPTLFDIYAMFMRMSVIML